MSTRALLHPLWWVSLAVLILNDWVLKGAGVLSPLVTGKLSDVAGLLMAPMLMAVLLRARSRRGVLACHVSVGLAFTLVKSSPTLCTWIVGAARALGMHWQVVCDRTDLWALPAVAASFYVFGRLPPASVVVRANQRFVIGMGVIAGAGASLATSMARPQFASAVWPQGRVVALRADHRLFLVDPLSGKTRLKLTLGEGGGFTSNGDWVIYWSVQQREARAYSLGQSKLVWERPLPAETCSARALSKQVLVKCPGTVRSWRYHDGERNWIRSGDYRGAVDDSVIVEDEGRLRVVDSERGTERFNVSAEGQFCLLPSGLYGLGRERLTRFELHTGAVVAVIERRSENDQLLCPFAQAGDPPEEASGLIESGAPLLVRSGETLWAHDPTTLEPSWQRSVFDSFDQRRLLAVATARLVVVGTNTGYVALDARTGNELWSSRKPSSLPPSSSPIVLVETHLGSEVYARDAQSGAELWRRNLEE